MSSTIERQRRFVEQAREIYERLGIEFPPFGWAVAQWTLETAWGSSAVFHRCLNWAGMTDGPGVHWERDGKTGFYACFDTLEDGMQAYANKFREHLHFGPCREAQTAEEFFDCLRRLGWAEDKGYAQKLRAVYKSLRHKGLV